MASKAALVLVGLFAGGFACGTFADAADAIVGAKFELFVEDLEAARRFYEVLGFSVEQKPDGYTTLRSGGTVIALSPIHTWVPLRWFALLRDPPLGTEIVLYASRLETLHHALEEAGYAPGSIARRPWGLRDFRVHDPSGYYVRITEGRPDA